MLNRCLITLILIVLSACNLRSPASVPPSPTPTATTIPVVATEGAIDTTTWQTIADGFEWRTYIPDDGELVQLNVLRIDPAKYRFRALYRAGDPLRVAEWQTLEPDADVIINANFFDLQDEVLGLLVSDGIAYGQSYQDRGGTFVVQSGIASVRANRSQPYQGEALEQAVQAFPLLVENGQQAYFNTTGEEINRRTVIAQDTAGNILLMATPFLGLSLADLSAYLPGTDLNIDTAFNLDGGGSTMMAVPDINLTIQSIDPVPSILAVYRR